MKNLEPGVYRQRLIIEGHYGIDNPMGQDVKNFLQLLSKILLMTIFSGPFSWPPDPWDNPIVELNEQRGLNGFVAWTDSGCHIYVWKKFKFFTVDTYSCKPFNADEVMKFTKNYFQSVDAVNQSI
jgi:hypothetical protein